MELDDLFNVGEIFTNSKRKNKEKNLSQEYSNSPYSVSHPSRRPNEGSDLANVFMSRFKKLLIWGAVFLFVIIIVVVVGVILLFRGLSAKGSEIQKAGGQIINSKQNLIKAIPSINPSVIPGANVLSEKQKQFANILEAIKQFTSTSQSK